MRFGEESCPKCGHTWKRRNPLLTVDLIIEVDKGKKIVLIKRKNPPYGWALPGGFVEYGETVEEAALREAMEETGLEVELKRQFHTYSDPSRDPRGHMVSVVLIGVGRGNLRGGDDACEARAFDLSDLPQDIVFDHAKIIQDYIEGRY